MSELINIDDHTTEHKVTAAEVEKNCPAELQDLAKRIAAHLEKARKCKQKAEQHNISAGQHLAQAQKLCDEGGFKAFHEKLCPNLGKSRAHELLQIATNKKSIEEIKDSTRERVAKHRAKRAASSVTVTDKAEPAAEPQQASVEAVTEQTPAPVERRGTVNPKDEALSGFSAALMDLVRRTKGTKLQRFAATSVPADDLARLGKYLSELAKLKKSRAKPTATAHNDNPAAFPSTDAVQDKLAFIDAAGDAA